MTKKSIEGNLKGIMNELQTQIDKGIPKQEILDKLSEEYSDKPTIVRLVASTIDTQTKSKYKTLNNVLLGLLLVTACEKFLAGISFYVTKSIFFLPMISVFPSVIIWFAIKVSKYKGYIYKTLCFYAVVAIIPMLDNYEGEMVWMLIDYSILGAIIGLSYYLGDKMFPNYGIYEPKKDEKGNPILE